MAKAARAIIIQNENILVMQRNKFGSVYFTLVGGRVNDGETIEEALQREIFEETGLTITSHELVYVEEHPEPYNQQYIYLCDIEPAGGVQIQQYSEEEQLNRLGANIHKLMWVPLSAFDNLQFRTPQLQKAILEALKKGFPEEPVKL